MTFECQALNAYSYGVATDLHRLPEHQIDDLYRCARRWVNREEAPLNRRSEGLAFLGAIRKSLQCKDNIVVQFEVVESDILRT